ncbi:hypothetical protein Tco_0295116 [Tanacetum coccineum]
MSTPVSTSSTDSQNGIILSWQLRLKDRPQCLDQEDIHSGDHVVLAVQQHTAQWNCIEHDSRRTKYSLSEEEAIFLLLTGIGDEIYSTVDACNTANEMWIAIERLQQGESLNVQDVKTNLFWEFGKFTSRDGESMESYYSRFYKLMNELTRNNLQVTLMQVNVQFLQQLQPEWSRFVTIVKQSEKIDTVSYHRLFDILKQFQLEVNDIRAERIAKSANPLALIAAAQPYSDNYYQAPKPQRSNATSSSTRQSASTRHKGKEIVNQLHLNLSLSLKKTVILNKLRGTRKCKRIWHSLQSISRSSTNLPTTTFELLQTPRTRLDDTAPSCWGLGKTAGQLGSATDWDTVLLTARFLGNYAKECKEAKAGIGCTLKLHGKRFRSVSPEGIQYLRPAMEQVQNHDEKLINMLQNVLMEGDALANLIANLTLDKGGKQNDFNAIKERINL